jgi:predicted nucleotidyltransferase component of viral defense system
MLHFETVEPHTFSILGQLMEMPELASFSLVGGTALSLLYGHRISVDLDLFSNIKFDNGFITDALANKFNNSFVNRSTNPVFGIFCFIDDVKVDIINHPHPLIRPLLKQEEVRMFSTEDIIAMKIQAVLGRGKKKDFWDIAELLKHFSIDDFIKFHKEKYATQNLLITIPHAITYFADADESDDPVSLKKQSWESVKNSIQEKVSSYFTGE